MATIINKIDAATAPFVGQGDLIIFAAISDYSTAKLSDFSSPQSLGQIVQDSTSWEGEDVSTDQILDEQGNLITAKVTAGTLSFSFDIASTSANMMKKFMAAADISSTNIGSPSWLTGSNPTPSAVGFGVDLPVFTVPILVADQEKKRAWVYPKAKITSNLAYSDGLYRIHAVVLAEQVDTAYLKTGILLEGALQYESA
jgi:hypothetical protein